MKERRLHDIFKHLKPDYLPGDLDVDSLSSAKDQEKIARINRFNQDSEERKKLTDWTKKIVESWLFFVGLLVAFGSLCFNMSDTLLIALLGSTTINVVSLAWILLSGYFKSHK